MNKTDDSVIIDLAAYRAAREAQKAAEKSVVGDIDTFVRDVLPNLSWKEVDSLFERLDEEARLQISKIVLRDMEKR
ncbi:hypothetical protein NS115_03735 [Paenibacillus jamilae]|uniref:Uncharacterized protein n=1 Tax=Paenibacillus jamilae TaxID=114136 RepID=A0ACC5A0I5_9BACL|nr:hypothetical protein [Paenibacillus jamilae]KTS84450.1 hypothetical protein NS115_03735 [Paenibacillus jamilae]